MEEIEALPTSDLIKLITFEGNHMAIDNSLLMAVDNVLTIYVFIYFRFWNLDLKVLAEDQNNVKALFRRGKARAELGQTDDAREDFLKAQKYAPEDKAITRELNLLAEHDKALYRKQKEIYKGIFGPRPEPRPKRINWIVLVWQWLLSMFNLLFNRIRRKAD